MLKCPKLNFEDSSARWYFHLKLQTKSETSNGNFEHQVGAWNLSLVSIRTFFVFCCSFWLSYQQKARTSNAIFKWKDVQEPKRATKSQNEQPKALFCLFWFFKDIISKTRTSNEEQQKATNGKKPQGATTSNKKQQRAFFFPIFIHLLQLWTHA